MKAQFALSNPDELEASLTITDTVGNLKRLRSQLQESDKAHHWPSSDFFRLLDKTISHAERHLEHDIPRNTDAISS